MVGFYFLSWTSQSHGLSVHIQLRCPHFPIGVSHAGVHMSLVRRCPTDLSDWPTQLWVMEERGNFWSQLLESGQMSQLLTEFELHFLPSASYLSNVCSFSFPLNFLNVNVYPLKRKAGHNLNSRLLNLVWILHCSVFEQFLFAKLIILTVGHGYLLMQ